MWLELPRHQRCTHEVFSWLCCHRCWRCRLRPPRIQTANGSCGPTERGTVCYLPACRCSKHSRLVRYANMDLALLSTLLPAVNSGITRILVSYDIGCQWSKNLENRLSLYSVSSSFKLSSLSYWRVVVPKFHLRGHGKDCQQQFNINFTKGAGMMTGEMIESGWAQSGSMAIWTRENGPFARRAVLDDHWSSENWRKLRRLREWILGFIRYHPYLPPP